MPKVIEISEMENGYTLHYVETKAIDRTLTKNLFFVLENRPNENTLEKLTEKVKQLLKNE